MSNQIAGEVAGFEGANSDEPALIHVPVLFQEVLTALQVTAGGQYIDATLGGGGHSAGILAASSPDGRLLGLDRDPVAIERVRDRLVGYEHRLTLAASSFGRISELARSSGFEAIDGIIFDLGLSSDQLLDANRGFAFRLDGPLDMRFNPGNGDPTAEDLVNGLLVEELVDILFRFGEEKHARRIAQAIVAARPIRTTAELASVVEGVVHRRGRIHPATRTFQALRIAVNNELMIIEDALPQAVGLLKPGGRLAVISFHSLEDRCVTRFFQRESRDCICPPEVPACVCDHHASLRRISRKPISPSADEVSRNPRSRSAHLRVVERIGV
ncbi:MAG: 16S rRNA (cytosine(1402)-N(4))-methyltransferase RsmH [Anaerolineae bacterium]|nr:16S rRNA (cytosine(1402)-N(4))-methyltransferase RsmH [Anaerolineae bacterium]